jgi:hypothetical protein
MPIVNKIHLLYNSSAALQNLHVQRGAVYYTKDSNKYMEIHSLGTLSRTNSVFIQKTIIIITGSTDLDNIFNQ